MRKVKFKLATTLSVVSVILVMLMVKAVISQELNRSDNRRSAETGLAGEAGMKEIGAILSLTEAQKEKLRIIMQDHRRESRFELFDKMSPILDSEQTEILSGIQSDLEKNKMPRTIIANRIERLDARLDLDQSQKEQLTQLFSEFGDKIIRIKQSDTDRGESGKEMKAQFKELHAKLETILSPGQMEKMEYMHKTRRERFGRKMGHRQRQGSFQKAFEELELSREQEARIEDILKESRDSFKQKIQDIDSQDERREAMKIHREEVAAKIESVLTLEQREIFAEIQIKQEKRRRRFPGIRQ